MDDIKKNLDEYEKGLHKQATDHIAENDKYIDMRQEDKDDLFEDSVAEFEKSINLMSKKFGVLDRKMS